MNIETDSKSSKRAIISQGKQDKIIALNCIDLLL